MQRNALFHARKQPLAPNGEISRTYMYLSNLLILLFTFLCLRSSSHEDPWLILAVFLGCSAWGLWYLLQLLRLERRRLRTLGGVQWLAPVQPAPWAIHNVRPIKITLRPWLYSAPALIGGVVLIIQVVWFPFTVSIDIQVPFFLFSLVAVIFITLFLRSTRSVQRATLEITPSGLITKETGARSEEMLTWSEARFFACYREPGLVGRYCMTYELSGQTTRVSWKWIFQPQSSLALWKPDLPADEYHRLMQGLCALIVMQTGLPLYDLSQPGKALGRK